MEIVELALESIAMAIDVVGIGILLWGFSLSLKDFIHAEISRANHVAALKSLRIVRCQLGTYLLMGLEFLIVSDIIHTFISRSQDDLIFLGVLIVIRTAIGFFLGKELQELHHQSS